MKQMSKALASLMLAASVTGVAQAKTTGMWYSTNYSTELNYTWRTGHGSGSTKQFLADVDNDGDADAVVYFSSGKWYVAKSNGNGFGGYSQWTSGHGVGSANQLMADVNGDGRADAVVYFSGSGKWYVATAKTTSGFNGYQLWVSGHGTGTENQMLGDVNGDGKADAVAYSSGKWYVATSSGSSFGSTSTWKTGHGTGSANQFIGDVNGDGKGDAIAFFNSGEWYVAKSSGTAFGGYSNWTDQTNAQSLGAGSANQMVGDINNDGKADAVAYDGDGKWYMLTSNGTNFIRPDSTYYIEGAHAALRWKTGHGSTGQVIPYSATTWTGLADVYGNGYAAPVAFRNSGGIWQALPGAYHASQPGSYNDYYFKGALTNTWQYRNYGYIPDGGTYDSGNASVISSHLTDLATAGVDFILLDETNNIFVDRKYVIRRALSVCNTIKSTGSSVKFAVAVGGIQFSNSAQTLENEAKHVYKLFIEAGGTYESLTRCSGANQYFNTISPTQKPLLVVYANKTQRELWENSGISKTYANKFNIMWAQGSVCASGSSTGCGYPVASGKVGEYVGWAFTDGAIVNNDTMVVMPGWDNHGASSTPAVSRNNGSFYVDKGWKRVLCGTNMPDMVVVPSYNDYAEETAVAPSDTSALSSSKQWSSNSQYWTLTQDYNLDYKSGSTYRCN